MYQNRIIMNDRQYNKLSEVAEAVLIVEGLSMLMNRFDTEFSNVRNQDVYQATVGFLKFVQSKYAAIASRPMTFDDEGNIIPKVITPQQLIRSSAQNYILQSMN